MYVLDEIFKLEETNDDRTVIKVSAKDPLTVAKFPFVNGKMEYITLTHGKKPNFMHSLIIVNEDGTTDHFDFNSSKTVYTIVDDVRVLLREQVLQFIKNNSISICN